MRKYDTHRDRPSVESVRTGGLAGRRSYAASVRSLNGFKQKEQDSKSLCSTRPRNDFVSRPQCGAAAPQGHGSKSTRPLGPATPKPGEGVRRCHTKTKTSAWPTLTGKARCAGNPRAASYPRRQLICTPAPSRRCLGLWSLLGLKYEPYIKSPRPRAYSRI